MRGKTTKNKHLYYDQINELGGNELLNDSLLKAQKFEKQMKSMRREKMHWIESNRNESNYCKPCENQHHLKRHSTVMDNYDGIFFHCV